MKIYDISLTISPGMVVWPGDPAVRLERVNKMEEGANANVSHFAAGVHTGTHVDAPVHFVPGRNGVDSLPLDVLVGPCQVVELPDSVDVITAAVVQYAGLAPAVKRILFKTRNSAYWKTPDLPFQTGFVAVDESGAKELAARGIQLVGIDYLSIAPYKNSRPAHQALLNASVVILEGCNLSEVPAGYYRLVCLPLKLKDSDGSPARAILLDE